MSTWFEQLSLRERVVMIVGGVAAALILAWSLAWTPLRNATFELDMAVTEMQGMVADVRRLDAMGARLRSQAVSTESLVLVVDQTHRAHGLGGTLSRNQPDGENGIRVTFQQAPFAQLVSWMGALEQGHGIYVVSANLDGEQEPGLVNVSLVLRRP